MQNIELDDMMTIVHGLKMAGLASVEPDALDPINERIRNLPSAEEIPEIYTSAREVERLCTEVGRIMELIDYYGTKGSEYTSRYKAKTGLPPRYKNLEWKKAGTKMKIKTAQNFPDESGEVDIVIQETKNIQMSIDETQVELRNFVDKLNQDIPQILQFLPPQYQSGLVQQQAIMNGAAKNLNESAEVLKQDAQKINEVSQQAGEVSKKTMEMSEMYSSQLGNAGDIGGIAASKNYIKGIVKLSSNMEGNGIVSDKLLSYAKCLSDNDPLSYYAALEVDTVLRHSNFNKEADTLIKTAGIWDKVKNVGKGLAGVPQGAGAGYQAGKGGGHAGVIDPGTQDQESWQTGDIEVQFKNDVDWLKRSWINLINFFERYVRDAKILESEWGKNSPDDEKVPKIVELREQAEALLKKAQEILASGNFSSKMMGADLFGPDKDKEDKLTEDDPDIIGPDTPPEGVDPTNPDPTNPDPTNPDLTTPVKNNPQISGRSNEEVLQESGDKALGKYLEAAMNGLRLITSRNQDDLNNLEQSDWNSLKTLVSKLQLWQRTNQDNIYNLYKIKVGTSKSIIKTANETEGRQALEQFELLNEKKWHEIDSVKLARAIESMEEWWINRDNKTMYHGETPEAQEGENPQIADGQPNDQAQIAQNPQLADQGIEYYKSQVETSNRNARQVFKKLMASDESNLVSITDEEWALLDKLANTIGMYQQKSQEKSTGHSKGAKRSFNLMRTSKFEGKQDFVNIKDLLSQGKYLNIKVDDFSRFIESAKARQLQLDPERKGVQPRGNRSRGGKSNAIQPEVLPPEAVQDPNAQKKTPQ